MRERDLKSQWSLHAAVVEAIFFSLPLLTAVNMSVSVVVTYEFCMTDDKRLFLRYTRLVSRRSALFEILQRQIVFSKRRQRRQWMLFSVDSHALLLLL
jgi:hypothetical protein